MYRILLILGCSYGRTAERVQKELGQSPGVETPLNGYWQIKIDGVKYLAHRLVWLWQHGEFPTCAIDHINGVRDDNRLANLRMAPRGAKDNQQNQKVMSTNTSGYAGVCRSNSKKNPWLAQIVVDGARIHLGLFPTFEAARTARDAGKTKYHTFNPTQRVN